MNEFYSWKPEYLDSVVGIISVSIGFAVYWFLSISPKIKDRFFAKHPEETAWEKYAVFQKMMGVLFMGVIPGAFALYFLPYTLADYGIKAGNYIESLIYIGIMGTLIVIINSRVAGSEFNRSMYPQMRVNNWGKKRILINSLALAGYLFAYEFMYRGLLLTVCYHSFGFWPAVAVNLSFYSATHIAKGKTETIGTFPYGLILCFVTISSGSIAVAFITHLILALSNDYFAVHHSPEMKFV